MHSNSLHRKIKILLVEDEKVTHRSISKALERHGYDCVGVYNLQDALNTIKQQPFDLILSDVILPDGTGIDFLEEVRKYLFSVPFVVLTASGKKSLMQKALANGASDFLTKPFNLENLPTIIERNLERRRLEDYKNSKKRTSMLFKTIQALITALEAKDSYTSGHSRRVARYALMMAEALKLTEHEKFILELSAILHDIGKIGMPDSILKKSTSLLDMEYKTAKEHTIIGSNIVGKIDELHEVAAIIRHHHERFDGTGYPDSLKGEAIPYFSRILAIVDAYESIVSDRVYSKQKSPETALEELTSNAGTQFDPVLVNIFAELIRNTSMRERQNNAS